jgi:hypothetical protein
MGSDKVLRPRKCTHGTSDEANINVEMECQTEHCMVVVLGRRLRNDRNCYCRWSKGESVIQSPCLLFQYGNVRPAITANVILATAILSAILLGLGVLRHYWDIYEHRSVRGISWGFVVPDAMGDLTSLIAIGKQLLYSRYTCIKLTIVDPGQYWRNRSIPLQPLYMASNWLCG